MKKKQYAFLVNMDKCIGCFTCAMACKNFYHQPKNVAWRNVYPVSEEIYPHRDRAFMSLSCNHCEHPACLKACPVRAYTKREEDGVVIQNNDRCIGCTNCIRSCPYGAPKYDSELKKAVKCDLCHIRLDAGLNPVCTKSCPTGALSLVDINNLNEPNAVQYPEGFPRMKKVNPSTRFILPKMPNIVRD